jgi:hypothetical protein
MKQSQAGRRSRVRLEDEAESERSATQRKEEPNDETSKIRKEQEPGPSEQRPQSQCNGGEAVVQQAG